MERRPSPSPGKASLTRVQGSRPTPAIGCNFVKNPSMKLKIEPAIPVILQKTPYPTAGFVGYPQPGGGAHPPIPSEGGLWEVPWR